MMMNKKTGAAAAAGVAVVAALVWAFAPRPVEVETGTVERGRFEQSIDEDGRTRLRDRYVVSAPVTARVSRITLREGDRVAAGDVIAVLTPVMASLYDERSMREATARAKAAQAGVAGADAHVERARLSQEEARLELQRTARLAAEGFLSASRLDSARLALSGAQRELQAAQAAREVAVYERMQAQAAVQPASPQAPAGQPLSVRAPISGVVLRLPVQSEGTVAAGAALMDIGDPSRMEVVAQLLTTDAVRAVPGTRSVIERWGGPPLEGRVRRVEPAAFTKVSALGIEEQRVNVLVDVVDPPPAWLQMGDGFRVTVRVVVVSAAEATLAPIGALFPNADGGMAAYVIDGSRARLRPVELAARNASMGWIRSGLQPGERVVVYAPPSVSDGTRVNMRKP
ncbi:MAG: HlyD family efflux transporter periplasmic adaptor subunit [Pseudomonadota bacterium]